MLSDVHVEMLSDMWIRQPFLVLRDREDGLFTWGLSWKVTSAGAGALEGELAGDEVFMWRTAEQAEGGSENRRHRELTQP